MAARKTRSPGNSLPRMRNDEEEFRFMADLTKRTEYNTYSTAKQIETTNRILSNQYALLDRMTTALETIVKSFDKNFKSTAAEAQKRDQAAELGEVEQRRSRQNNRTPRVTASRSSSTFSSGGILDGFLSILKTLAIPYLLGFVNGVADVTKAWDKIKKYTANTFEWLDKKFHMIGDIVGDVTGNKGLGAIISNFSKFIAPLGAASLLIGFKNISNFVKLIGNIGGKMGGISGGGLLKTLGKFGTFFTVITTIFETISGAVDGFQKDGILGAFSGGAKGYLKGFIGTFANLGAWLTGSLLEAFGFDKVGGKIKGFDFSKWFDGFADSVGSAISDLVGGAIDYFKEAMKGGLTTKLGDLLLKPFTMLSDFIKDLTGFDPREITRKIITSLPEAVQKIIPDAVYRAAGLPVPGAAPELNKDRTRDRSNRANITGDDIESKFDAGQQQKFQAVADNVRRKGSASAGDEQALVNTLKDAGSSESDARRYAKVTTQQAVLKHNYDTTGGPGRGAASSAGGASDSGNASKELLDSIASGESGSAGYDAVYGGSKVKPDKPVSDMTVDEVLAFQQKMLKAGSASTAVGRYQFLSKTLQGLVKDGVVSGGDKFDQKTQDKLATALLNQGKNNLKDYQAGKVTGAQFQDHVAGIWASVKNSSGKGTYDGDGLNAGSTSGASIIAAAGKPTGAALASASGSGSSGGNTVNNVSVDNSKNVAQGGSSGGARPSAAAPAKLVTQVS